MPTMEPMIVPVACRDEATRALAGLPYADRPQTREIELENTRRACQRASSESPAETNAHAQHTATRTRTASSPAATPVRTPSTTKGRSFPSVPTIIRPIMAWRTATP